MFSLKFASSMITVTLGRRAAARREQAKAASRACTLEKCRPSMESTRPPTLRDRNRPLTWRCRAGCAKASNTCGWRPNARHVRVRQERVRFHCRAINAASAAQENFRARGTCTLSCPTRGSRRTRSLCGSCPALSGAEGCSKPGGGLPLGPGHHLVLSQTQSL